jgi:hypothetical protein
VVMDVPRVPGGDSVGLKWDVDIILKFDKNRGETRVILSYLLSPETWCGAFYGKIRQKILLIS